MSPVRRFVNSTPRSHDFHAESSRAGSFSTNIIKQRANALSPSASHGGETLAAYTPENSTMNFVPQRADSPSGSSFALDKGKAPVSEPNPFDVMRADADTLISQGQQIAQLKGRGVDWNTQSIDWKDSDAVQAFINHWDNPLAGTSVPPKAFFAENKVFTNAYVQHQKTLIAEQKKEKERLLAAVNDTSQSHRKKVEDLNYDGSYAASDENRPVTPDGGRDAVYIDKGSRLYYNLLQSPNAKKDDPDFYTLIDGREALAAKDFVNKQQRNRANKTKRMLREPAKPSRKQQRTADLQNTQQTIYNINISNQFSGAPQPSPATILAQEPVIGTPVLSTANTQKDKDVLDSSINDGGFADHSWSDFFHQAPGNADFGMNAFGDPDGIFGLAGQGLDSFNYGMPLQWQAGEFGSINPESVFLPSLPELQHPQPQLAAGNNFLGHDDVSALEQPVIQQVVAKQIQQARLPEEGSLVTPTGIDNGNAPFIIYTPSDMKGTNTAKAAVADPFSQLEAQRNSLQQDKEFINQFLEDNQELSPLPALPDRDTIQGSDEQHAGFIDATQPQHDAFARTHADVKRNIAQKNIQKIAENQKFINQLEGVHVDPLNRGNANALFDQWQKDYLKEINKHTSDLDETSANIDGILVEQSEYLVHQSARIDTLTKDFNAIDKVHRKGFPNIEYLGKYKINHANRPVTPDGGRSATFISDGYDQFKTILRKPLAPPGDPEFHKMIDGRTAVYATQLPFYKRIG